MSDHAEIINMLAATFDRYAWDERALAGYLLALSDLDIDLLRSAASTVLRTHTGKMPTPVELRRAALRQDTDAVDPPAVDEAWSEVLASIGHYGRYVAPDWTHPLIGQAVEYCGGWGRLCNSTDQTGDRIAFTRTYRTCVERAEREALLAPGLAPGALGALGARALPAFRLRHIDDASRWRPALAALEVVESIADDQPPAALHALPDLPERRDLA